MKVRRIDFSPAEWLEGTAELTDADRGIYITICALIWSRGERPTIELLKRHSRSHGNAINAALDRLETAGKIVRNGPEIGQKRAENELETAQIRLEKASENGARGNQIKALKHAARTAAANANHQPSTINHHKNPPNPPRGAFDEWWSTYPNKVGRRAAAKAYEQAIKRGATPEQLLAGLERYIASKPPDRPWCNPTTFLNQDRHLDEPPPPLSNGHDHEDDLPVGGDMPYRTDPIDPEMWAAIGKCFWRPRIPGDE